MPSPPLDSAFSSVTVFVAIPSVSAFVATVWEVRWGRERCMKITGQGRCVSSAWQSQAATPCSEAHLLQAVCVSTAGAVQHGEPIDQPGGGSPWLFRRAWLLRG